MTKKRNKAYQIFLDIIISVIGCFLFSYALDGFIKCNEIAVGGAGGIASAISSAFGVKMGTILIFINIPVLILAWFFLGKRFTINTTLVIFGAVMMDYYVVPFLPQFKDQPLLGAIYGGLIFGFGIALIFTRGFTTGGTDIIGRLIQLKFPSVSIGKILMIMDIIIVCVASYIYTLGEGVNDWKMSEIYGFVTIFIYTKTIDFVLAGFNQAKAMYIISDKCDQISQNLISNISHGLTKMKIEKVYSKKEGDMILCVVRANEISKVRKIIKDVDKDAFLIILNVEDVVGNNFHQVGLVDK